MPKRPSAPRLWLRKGQRDGAARAPFWHILDKGKQIATGFKEDEILEAQQFLKEYILQSYPQGWAPRGVPKMEILPETGIIYFISTDEVPSYPIKIGYSTHATFDVRRITLQISSPYVLKVLATVPGSQRDELEFHYQLSGSRMRGEWFRRTSELMAIIESLSDATQFHPITPLSNTGTKRDDATR